MPTVRLFAVMCLAAWSCGCSGKTQPTLAGGKPVGHWIDEVKSPDPGHRKEAVEKLGNVGPADPDAFPAVCSALKDPDSKVRCEAVLAVLKFGEAAKDALPLLEEMRKNDRNPKAREYASRAIEKLRSGG